MSILDAFRRKNADTETTNTQVPKTPAAGTSYTVKLYTPEKVIVPEIELTEKQAIHAGFSFRKKSRCKVSITRYKGVAEELVIPAKIGGMTVNEISHEAFRNTQIRHLQIPGTVVKMGGSAFRQGLLETVRMGEGMTTVGELAFWDCYHLRKVELPTTMRRIGSFAFDDCKELKTIHIPRMCTELGVSAFIRTGLTDIYAETGYTIRNGKAFYLSEINKRYDTIFAREGCVLLIRDGADVSYDDMLCFCEGSLFGSVSPRPASVDLSRCRRVDFRDSLVCDSSYVSKRTRMVVPGSCTDLYFPPHLEVFDTEGRPVKDYYNMNLSNGGKTLTLQCKGRVMPSHALDCKGAVELIIPFKVDNFKNYAISGESLESVHFQAGLSVRGNCELFCRAPHLHEFSWVQTENGEQHKYEIFIPPTELIGWNLHRHLLGAFCSYDVPLSRIYGKRRHRSICCFFDKRKLTDVFNARDMAPFSPACKHPIGNETRILISIDALRSSPECIGEDREVYKKFLCTHKRFARTVCGRLHEKWHSYGEFLETVISD